MVYIQESSREDGDGCEDEIKVFVFCNIVAVGERHHHTALCEKITDELRTYLTANTTQLNPEFDVSMRYKTK